MNILKRTLKWGLLTVTGLIAILYITDTDYLLKALRTVYAKGYTTAFLEDYKEFDNAEIELILMMDPWRCFSMVRCTSKMSCVMYLPQLVPS